MKVERATAYLKELQDQTRLFRQNPYTVSEKDDTEQGLYRMFVALNAADRRLATVIGEFAYALRSGLDNLAWQLSLLSGKSPSRLTAFPIHSSDSLKDRKRFLQATWDIPCEAVEAIKSFQPHLRGKAMKSDPLWRLNKLCNLDKHQTIAYSSTETRITPMMYDGVPNPVVIPHEESGITEFVMPLAHKGKVKLKLEPPRQIFGKPIDGPGGEFELSEADIVEIHEYVRDKVLPAFAKFFPMGSSIWPPTVDGRPATK